jgi:hypothetical protein
MKIGIYVMIVAKLKRPHQLLGKKVVEVLLLVLTTTGFVEKQVIIIIPVESVMQKYI